MTTGTVSKQSEDSSLWYGIQLPLPAIGFFANQLAVVFLGVCRSISPTKCECWGSECLNAPEAEAQIRFQPFLWKGKGLKK